MPNYFLAKTDPKTYSIQDFVREKRTIWDGVHSHQAIYVIKDWKVGDFVYIYHSMAVPSLVGLAKVISEPFENKADLRYSWASELELITEFTSKQKELLTLKSIKTTGKFNDFALIRQSRLSTMACPANFVHWVNTILEENI